MMSDNAIITPTHRDVLCGRGSSCFEHAGNLYFRIVISMHLPKYANPETSRKEKIVLVQNIVEDIKRDRRRFLRAGEEGNAWVELNSDEAKKKVGHAIRDATSEMERYLKKERIPKKKNSRKRMQDACQPAAIPSLEDLSAELNISGEAKKKGGHLIRKNTTSEMEIYLRPAKKKSIQKESKKEINPRKKLHDTCQPATIPSLCVSICPSAENLSSEISENTLDCSSVSFDSDVNDIDFSDCAVDLPDDLKDGGLSQAATTTENELDSAFLDELINIVNN